MFGGDILKKIINIKGVITFTLIILFVIFSELSLVGALKGIKLCYYIVVPSIFPLTVLSLMLFELNILKSNNSINIYLMSLIGGFPVGAKLIENAYQKGNISKKNSELMLCYCLNSTPAFIVSSVGVGILSDIRFGFVLFFSNLLSSLIIMIMVIPFKEKNKLIENKVEQKTFCEAFVKSTYDATNTMLTICGFIVLFSSVIEILQEIIGRSKHFIIYFLELTNGIVLADGSIYFIAFLIGFSCICVHFQVLAVCKTLKPGYILLFIFRVIHGLLMMFISKIIVKLFDISVVTSHNYSDKIYKFSEVSVLFGIAFITLSIFFIISVSKENNKM